jgi:DNA topoisomerase I
MDLIIVESPTKAKTISKFLGSKYKVTSSFGHIRDLPKSNMGVDVENDFEPKYVIPTKAKKTVTELKNLAEKSNRIILAPDEDREGEAIAWHLTKALKIDEKKAERIVFHEITKEAIKKALEKPRKINLDLVDAQQARRILDRLVGYELSPFLWKKVVRGLSAGRVQSVTVRLIVEREREIKAFKSDEYWTIEANFSGEKDKEKIFQGKLSKIDNKTLDKFDLKKEDQVQGIVKELKKKKYSIKDISRREVKKNPLAPFITSTLQQEANNKLGFSSRKTMMIAQQLYEGLDVGEGHTTGLITYMRTDSVNLSQKFLGEAKDFIKNKYGDKYALSSPRFYKTKQKLAQEAHEAIRPTEVNLFPEGIKNYLNKDQFRLYDLIWRRSVATQMAEGIMDSTTVKIITDDNKYLFSAHGNIIIFDGYLKIYPDKIKENQLPDLKKDEKANLLELSPEQHFTQPPARYNDATLVKTLEKYGIGRPSTYAPTINTVLMRGYVEREGRNLKPKDVAFLVTDLLTEHFSQIVDYKFTAKIEDDFDKVAEGKEKWQKMIADFYKPFKSNLKHKEKEVKKEDLGLEEKTDEVCDKCGKPMIIKLGRFGKFLACSGYPECKNTKQIDPETNKPEETEEIKEKCDKCGKPMIIKLGRFGKFLACSGYPECKNIKSIKKGTGVKCPGCKKGEIVEKKTKKGRIFYACDQYPKCDFALWSKPTGKICDKCKGLMVYGKGDTEVCPNKECL